MIDEWPSPTDRRQIKAGFCCQSIETPCGGAIPCLLGPRKSGQSRLLELPSRRKTKFSSYEEFSRRLTSSGVLHLSEGIMPPRHSIVVQLANGKLAIMMAAILIDGSLMAFLAGHFLLLCAICLSLEK